MSSDLMLSTGSLKGDYLKPKIRLDEMVIKRGDSGKGESIRPKLTVMKNKKQSLLYLKRCELFFTNVFCGERCS